MKYARTMDESFPIAYERDKPGFDAPIMFWDGTTARLQDEDIVCLGHPRCLSFYMRRQYIIKEADTIEELCDEFVVKMGDEHVTTRTMLELRDMNNYVQAIYGVIKMGKKRIRVTKMNEEGEWELL